MAWDALAPSWMTWDVGDGSNVSMTLDPNPIARAYGLSEHQMTSHYIKTVQQMIQHHDSVGILETGITTIGLDVVAVSLTMTERPVDGHPCPVNASEFPQEATAITQGSRWVRYLKPRIAGVDYRISVEVAGGAELERDIAESEAASVIADFRKDKVLGGETAGGTVFTPKAGSDVEITIDSGMTMLSPRNSTSPVNPTGLAYEYIKFVETATPTELMTHPLAAYVNETNYYGSKIAGIAANDIDNASLAPGDVIDPLAAFLVSVTMTLNAGANSPATTSISWTVMPHQDAI